MIRIIRQTQTLALSILFAAGTASFAIAQTSNSNAQNTNAQDNTQAASIQTSNNSASSNSSMVRNAQQQLKNDGYYTGKIDGIDGPMTRQAIKKYQQSQNLTVNGRLDQQTCQKLGVQNQ